MVIFHSYVSLPEGIYIYIYTCMNKIFNHIDLFARQTVRLDGIAVRFPCRLRNSISCSFQNTAMGSLFIFMLIC